MINCVVIGTSMLCGQKLPLAQHSLGWHVREFATCDRCKLLVAVAEANGLTPASEPSLRAALDKLLKENSIVFATK